MTIEDQKIEAYGRQILKNNIPNSELLEKLKKDIEAGKVASEKAGGLLNILGE